MGRTTVHDVAVLGRGSHLHPGKGACLLELTSTLPGGRWTDHPAAVDPVLAALARAVNDYTSDGARRALVPLAPWLLTEPVANAHQRTAVVVAGLAGWAALGHADASTAARLAPAVSALTDPRGGPGWLWWQGVQQRRRAVRVIRSAVRTLSRTADADDIMRRLLLDAVNLTRGLDGLPPVPATRIVGCPASLPVQVEVRVPDGAESTYYHCTALLDQWPVSLSQAWAAHASELRLLAERTPGSDVPNHRDRTQPVR